MPYSIDDVIEMDGYNPSHYDERDQTDQPTNATGGHTMQTTATRPTHVKSDGIAKGARVRLRGTGWTATIVDGHKKRFTRLALVEGDYTEYGSIYACNIEAIDFGGVWVPVETVDAHKPTPFMKAFGY